MPSMSVGVLDVLVGRLCFVVLSGSTREAISLCQDFFISYGLSRLLLLLCIGGKRERQGKEEETTIKIILNINESAK